MSDTVDVEVETPPRTSRTVVPGVAMIAVTFGLARYGYGLLLPEMQTEFGMGPDVAGLVSSGAYLAYLVANAGVVWVTTRYGPRVSVGLAALLAAVGMTTIAAASTVPALAVGVLVAGAAAGVAFPPYADLVDRQVRPAHRDVGWSAISSGTGWGVAVAGPIAIVAGDQWRLAWAAFAGVAVVVGSLALRLTPARNGGRSRRPQLSRTWFLCPRSGPLLVSAVIVGVTSSVWWAFGVDAMREAGIEATAARIVYAACGTASLLASFSGFVFDRIGLRAGYLITCLLLAASLALFGLGTSQLPVALVAAVMFGVFYCAVIAAHGIWSSRVFAQHPAAGLAAVSTALTVGTLLGPTVAGLALGFTDYRATLVAAGVLTLVSVAFSPPTAAGRIRLAAHKCTAAPVRE